MSAGRLFQTVKTGKTVAPIVDILNDGKNGDKTDNVISHYFCSI